MRRTLIAVIVSVALAACDSNSPQAPPDDSEPCKDGTGAALIPGATIDLPTEDAIGVPAGTTVTFEGTCTSNDTPPTCRWRLNGAVISETSPVVYNFDLPGEYTVTLTSCINQERCCVSDTCRVSVYAPAPEPGLLDSPVTAPDGLDVTSSLPGMPGAPVALVAGMEGVEILDLATGGVVPSPFGTTTPRLGAIFQRGLARADEEAAVVRFGSSTGAILTPWDPGTGDWSGFSAGLQSGMQVWDALPYGGTESSHGFTLTSDTRVGFHEYESVGWGPGKDVLNSDFPGGTAFRSTFAVDGVGPFLVVASSGTLYLHPGPPGNAAAAVGAVGADPRRIRGTAGLCVVTSFADDQLTVVSFDGTTASIVGSPISVGDGPVGLDLRELPNGNVAVLSTGFQDHSAWLTVLSPAGALVSNAAVSLNAACLQPAHAAWIGDTGLFLVSCFGSDKMEVVDSGL